MTVYYPLNSICETQTGRLIRYTCMPYHIRVRLMMPLVHGNHLHPLRTK